jgi:hypothetical protein
MTSRPVFHLGDLQDAVGARLAEMEHARIVERIWERDYTIWSDEPREISDRLGWLDLPTRMRDEVATLKEMAEDATEYDRIVLLGMGGSSLAPEVMSRTFGGKALTVLDTTHPEPILELGAGDLRRTLFVVSSKSGTTIETLSQFAYFYDIVENGSQFIAITDAGSHLERLANEKGFRRAFLNPQDVGGRFSALSYFGLVPAALVGIDIGALLDTAEAMADACSNVTGVDNPGLALGAAIAVAALEGRDKLTLLAAEEIASFGTWLEQLIAESLGKDGKGIVPVAGEAPGPPSVYSGDRLFAEVGVETGVEPGVTLPLEDRTSLGAEFFRWEFATAVAGHVLRVHPFDQPNVQEAKDATDRRLKAPDLAAPETGGLSDLLAGVQPHDYIAILAFLPRNETNDSRLQAVRNRLRERYRVATTVGFGPRYLHSTGQLHKGGPSTGVFIQVVDEPGADAAIPGQEYTFRRLLDAQSAGDLETLRAHGRRVARTEIAELEEV